MITATIDVKKTGSNLQTLIKERNINVAAVTKELGLTTPNAVYKWLRGETLPTIDNLFLLSILLDVKIDEILVGK